MAFQEFAYPENISFPVGGVGQEHFILMEMHYDNPNQQSGKTHLHQYI